MQKAAQSLSFSEEDIRILIRHPDAQKRAGATQRICHQIRRKELSKADRQKAHKVLRYIAKDVAAIVRRALAVTLKSSRELPHDVAAALVNDIDNIAVPILECSPVLTDEDLLDILRSKAAAKIMAIARRPSISGGIVRALIRHGDSNAVADLAANDHVHLDEQACNEMIDLYGQDDLIHENLVSRRELPVGIVERLITQASEEVALSIISRHNVTPDIAIQLAERTRERATIDFVDQSWVARDLRLLTRRLDEEGRLTPSLILRAAACGQMRFTEYSLARLAGVSHAKAALMLHETGAIGISALCKRAGIQPQMQHIIDGARVIYRDLEMNGADYDRTYFQRVMIERVLSLPVNMSDEDMDYLLEKLDYLAVDSQQN